MERIAKYSGLKKRSLEMGGFLSNLVSEHPNRPDYLRLKDEVLNCANYLVFNHYYTIDQLRLSKARTCKKHLLCPFCARRRASKMVEKNSGKFLQVITENPHLKPAMLTITVKNGDDLLERIEHLQKLFRVLQSRRRDYLKKGRGFNEFCKVQGAVFSYEVTYSTEGGWHPHIHALVFLDTWIDREELSRTIKEITGDSSVIDIRRIKKSKVGNQLSNIDGQSNHSSGIVDAMQEVFKYALKFSDLSLERQFEAYEILKSKRLVGSFGLLHGVKMPESLLDDLTDFENLPYNELVYTFDRRKSSYDLKKFTACKSASEAPYDVEIVDTETGEIRCLYGKEGRLSKPITTTLNDDAGIEESGGDGERGDDPNTRPNIIPQSTCFGVPKM